jgi:hypothetical protein
MLAVAGVTTFVVVFKLAADSLEYLFVYFGVVPSAGVQEDAAAGSEPEIAV